MLDYILKRIVKNVGSRQCISIVSIVFPNNVIKNEVIMLVVMRLCSNCLYHQTYQYL